MTPDALHSLTRNRFFLARVYGPVRGADVEALLGVTDAQFQELDELSEAHGRTEVDEDSDLGTRFIAVPIFLPAGYRWDVEYYDNEEDAGVRHLLCSPGGEPVTIARVDAHSAGEQLLWTDARKLIAAARADARNAPSVDALLLLLRGVIVLEESDDPALARDELGAAWVAVGVLPDVAASIASVSVPRMHVEVPDDDSNDAGEAREVLAGLIAQLPT